MTNRISPPRDAWSFYDFKSTFLESRPQSCTPSWVPTEHHRRLRAYELLDDYYKNSGRRWLGAEMDQDDVDERREYGDAHLIVESIRSSVLGDEQTVVVEGAVDNPDGPEAALQKLLIEWMDKEQFTIKATEAERNAVKLGDAVLVVGWDDVRKRPRIVNYNPGFYFPVLPDSEGDSGENAAANIIANDYPGKVHIAWEFERKVGDKTHTFVRRLTWELRAVTESVSYPWGASNWACFHTDAEWDLEGQPNTTVMLDLSIGGATTVFADNIQLGVDFIPLVHIPNTVADEEHYGTSSLASVIQMFDDLAATDSDLQAASSVTGSPVLALPGMGSDSNDSYGPGEVIYTGDNGKADLLSASGGLDALLKMSDALRDRLSVNSRTPRTLLGAVDPSKVNSGIILTLSFSPHSRLINEMRLVRKMKYDLILKMVSRFYMLNKQIDQIFPAHFKLGSYLPADKMEAITIVQQGLTAHAFSEETGVQILIQAGFPIDDAAAEIDRIRQQNFDAADKMLTATADMQAVRDRLKLGPLPTGLEPPAPGNNPPSGNDSGGAPGANVPFAF